MRFTSYERQRVLHGSETAVSCLRCKRFIQINLQSIRKIPRTANFRAGDIFYFPLSPLFESTRADGSLTSQPSHDLLGIQKSAIISD